MKFTGDFKRAILLILFMVCLVSYCVHFRDYPYLGEERKEQVENLISEIKNVLVAEDLCEDRDQCSSEEFVFHSSSDKLIHISVFRSNELSASIINEIARLCIESYYRLEEKISVELEVYNKTIDELNRPFSGIKPFIHLLMYSLEGEK